MKLVGKEKLIKFARKHADTRNQINTLIIEIKKADWKTPEDIKSRYSPADFLKNNRVVINIKGNSYRCVLVIRYQPGIVYVEKIGTHAEYDKWSLN